MPFAIEVLVLSAVENAIVSCLLFVSVAVRLLGTVVTMEEHVVISHVLLRSELMFSTYVT